MRGPGVCLPAFLCALSACTPADTGSSQEPGPRRPAQRIVTLAPHLAELVFTAGAGERLVGVVEHTDFPPATAAIARVGDAFRIDLERLNALEPDLILAWESGNPAAQVERLGELGYRVEVFRTRDLDDVAEALVRIGALAGTEKEAAAQAEAYRSGLARLRDQHAGRPRLSVFYQISAQPLYTVNKQHSISGLIELCGGRNIFGDLGALAPVVSHEAVVVRDPQVILAGHSGPGEPLAVWSRWPQMRAVATGDLYVIDPDYVTRASTRLVEGGRRICAALESARLH